MPIIANEIRNEVGTGRPQGAMDFGEYILGKMVLEVDSTTYSTTSTGFLDFKTWTNQTGFTANSLLEICYHVPTRSDTTNWGGLYIEPWISFNNGTNWLSLGHGGYDGGVMMISSNSIHHYNNLMVIDPAQTATYSVRLKFRYRVYDASTGIVNGSHDINGGAGLNSSYLTNNSSHLQHFMHYTIKEWIKF